MSWGYRLVEVTDCGTGEKWYSVARAFYNKDGSLSTWSEEGVIPGGETIDELRDCLNKMLEAVGRPDEVIREVF